MGGKQRSHDSSSSGEKASPAQQARFFRSRTQPSGPTRRGRRQEPGGPFRRAVLDDDAQNVAAEATQVRGFALLYAGGRQPKERLTGGAARRTAARYSETAGSGCY